MLKVIGGIVIGMALGAIVGHVGQCSSGTCPLTANPFRGAIYGGILGALFALTLAGERKRTGADASPPDKASERRTEHPGKDQSSQGDSDANPSAGRNP